MREVYLDRFNQVGWDFQRGRLLAALELWKVRHVRVETNSIGSPNLEALRQAALSSVVLAGFETTSKTKPPLIQRLALAFEKAVAQWLPDPIAKHELLAYEATVTETGYVRYSAPEGGFDDTVIARALAWHAARPHVPIRKTLDEQINERLPETWQDSYLRTLPPPMAQGYYEARRETVDEIKQELTNRRRPATQDSELIEDIDGGVEDIY